MVPVPRWWLNRSRAERFDISLRWPLYTLCLAEFFVAVLITFAELELRVPGVALFWLVAAAHTVANLLLLRASLRQYLGGPRVSRRLVGASIALAAAGVGAASLAFPRFTWAGSDLDLRTAVFLLMGVSLTYALTPMLRGATLLAILLAGAAVTAALALHGGAGIAYLFPAATLVFTCRATAWTLRLGWEIDASRAVSAQLAIAEERLRFGRDLHDTLGRNLSLVAVQSELAAALASRGDPKAAEQMLDVRRIAHDSLREMRAVVSGYRSTDLSTELAGAQSVLRSAGVSCRVIGDGATLPLPMQAALGWVVREATTNVIHHSIATTCTIELTVTATDAVLRMENDGVRAATSTAGTGLPGLRERLSELGGSLTVEKPAGRFVLIARLPVLS